MPLSDHVSLTISQDTLGVARAGFGVPMILSATASFPERIRFYNSLADVAEDFASTTGPEYLAAQAIFSQQPHPERIAIGRSALPPTQKYEITVAAVRNSHLYSIGVKGDGVTADDAEYTSDSSATQQEIANGLKTALNAVTGKNYTAAFPALVVADVEFTATHGTETITLASGDLETGDGPFRLSTSAADLPDGLLTATDYWWIKTGTGTGKLALSLALALAGTNVTFDDNGTGTHTLSDTADTVSPYDGLVVTGSAAGEWFSLEIDPADLTIEQTHVNPGIATDLDAIQLENDDWYALYTLYNSNAYVLAAADWIEAQKKIYLPDVNDSEAITTAAGNSDTLDDLGTANYARTMGAYHPNPSEMLGAAWLGRCLPLEPGSETWKFKTLAGVEPVTLTGTQRTNLVNRSANSYQEVAGVAITFEGTTGDGDFLDTQRGLDWLYDDMSKSVFEALAGADKIPFTDAGVAVIEAEVRGSLRRAVTRGILADDPAPVVTVPKVADVSSGNRALRLLPDVKFSGTLAGAIHKVVISGVVSV